MFIHDAQLRTSEKDNPNRTTAANILECIVLKWLSLCLWWQGSCEPEEKRTHCIKERLSPPEWWLKHHILWPWLYCNDVCLSADLGCL